MKTACIPFAIAVAVMTGACTQDKDQTSQKMKAPPAENATQAVNPAGTGSVFVHLFEWRWQDIAAECENFLGPNGYAAVQVSPPNEHITGPQWWTRYQPVSYRIESRSGGRAKFEDMVSRCQAAGVDVYADAITNHMAGIFTGTGIGGSTYAEYDYPVPYGYDDFHHCGRYADDRIRNYQDLWEVQHCKLGTLQDLDTSKPAVQEKIATYLNDLLGLGVAGFRLDAAKHIPPGEVTAYLALLDSTPFIYQEVIDRGNEPINAADYLANGSVTEFKYQLLVSEAFQNRQLGRLAGLGTQAGYLPQDKAIVFVDNHDLQRGHAGDEGTLSYKDGALYELANVFMLAWPYGYPMVMSSYAFDDTDQGPPQSQPVDGEACSPDWVCEHRRPAVTAMIGFRKAAAGAGVDHWQIHGDTVVSFSRGEKSHVIINAGDETVEAAFATGMAPGEYCNVLEGAMTDGYCNGPFVTVGDDGVVQTSVAPMSAVAIHTRARKQG